MHSTNLVCFYPTPAKLVSARSNTDCLAALNGISTKRPSGLVWAIAVQKQGQ